MVCAARGEGRGSTVAHRTLRFTIYRVDVDADRRVSSLPACFHYFLTRVVAPPSSNSNSGSAIFNIRRRRRRRRRRESRSNRSEVARSLRTRQRTRSSRKTSSTNFSLTSPVFAKTGKLTRSRTRQFPRVHRGAQCSRDDHSQSNSTIFLFVFTDRHRVADDDPRLSCSLGFPPSFSLSMSLSLSFTLHQPLVHRGEESSLEERTRAGGDAHGGTACEEDGNVRACLRNVQQRRVVSRDIELLFGACPRGEPFSENLRNSTAENWRTASAKTREGQRRATRRRDADTGTDCRLRARRRRVRRVNNRMPRNATDATGVDATRWDRVRARVGIETARDAGSPNDGPDRPSFLSLRSLHAARRAVTSRPAERRVGTRLAG